MDGKMGREEVEEMILIAEKELSHALPLQVLPM